ncbi:LVIVD repeat-containing protein [Rufibacter roseus]|uniref:LVIVD repeat-containing protein n=1 Tax=Rufibacter roseus TaxID=1567108 RepID=A0ABW2DP54_9BACT|nr:hypothetical protein [Rufibacter roseus]
MKSTTVFINMAVALVCFLSACGAEHVAPTSGTTTGQGGSMARFAVTGDHLYTIDHNNLHLFDISRPKDPVKSKSMGLGFGIETIFPFQDKLFIGSQTGMSILSIQDPSNPTHVSSYEHVVSCDPVVTDGRYAYVTLSSGTTCRQSINELQIIDIQNMRSLQLLKRYPMTNPKGLGVDGNLLFVCDNGLKVFDASNVQDIQLKHHFKINAYDVIPYNGQLLVIGSDGFYQYRYNGESIELLSSLPVEPAG